MPYELSCLICSNSRTRQGQLKTSLTRQGQCQGHQWQWVPVNVCQNHLKNWIALSGNNSEWWSSHYLNHSNISQYECLMKQETFDNELDNIEIGLDFVRQSGNSNWLRGFPSRTFADFLKVSWQHFNKITTFPDIGWFYKVLRINSTNLVLLNPKLQWCWSSEKYKIKKGKLELKSEDPPCLQFLAWRANWWQIDRDSQFWVHDWWELWRGQCTSITYTDDDSVLSSAFFQKLF